MTWLWVALTAVFLIGVWLFSLWRWPYRRSGRLRSGARLMHRYIAQDARPPRDYDDWDGDK